MEMVQPPAGGGRAKSRRPAAEAKAFQQQQHLAYGAVDVVAEAQPFIKIIDLHPPTTPVPTARALRQAAERQQRLVLGLTPRARGLIFLNIVMLACASMFVVLKEHQAGVDPFVFSAVRFAVAAAAFSPFWRRAARDARLVRAGAEIGVWAAGGYLTQSVAMVTADASRGAFLSGLTVVIVPVLAGVFGAARLKRTAWAAVGAALVGVALLEDGGAPASWGDFWALASALLFGLQIWRTEHWSKACGGAKNALPMMSVCLAAVAALAAAATAAAHPAAVGGALRRALGLGGGGAPPLLAAPLPWGALLYTALGVTCAGLWLETVALQDVSATEAAIIYTMEPVAGAAFAWLRLGERWGPSGWAGAALIVASCAATQLYGAEKGGGPGAGGGSAA